MKTVSILISFLLIFSCATLKKEFRSRGEYTLKNEFKSPSTIFRILEDPKKKIYAEIRSPLIPAVTLTGDVSTDLSGDYIFAVRKIRLFTNWSNGWTDTELEAFGTLRLIKNQDQLTVNIIEKIETGDIIKAGIRYLDDYYSGEKAVKSVKNKLDRIEAVVEILKKKEYPAYFGHSWRKTAHGVSMRETVYPFLFPELSVKKDTDFLTAGPQDVSSDATGDRKINKTKWKVSETIAWNTFYTRKAFPDYLYEVRDSGTLLRDYEETEEFFQSFYNREYYYNSILTSEILVQKK